MSATISSKRTYPLGTEMVTALESRQRLLVAASIIVVVTGGVALFLYGPFLEARFALALRGIAPEDYPRALHDACARGDTEALALLALAVALDRPEVAATLADYGANIDARVVSPSLELFAALFDTRLARKYLIKDRGLTPLMLAILKGRRDTVRVLLDRNARLDTPTAVLGTWPIGLAAYQEDVRMMQLLLGRDPDPAKQRRRILVSLADQSAALYVDVNVHMKTRVSTGREGYETPPGDYAITNKYRSWTSTLYDAPMPFFLRLNAGAVGLHEGVVPGHPASHGCTRVPRRTAQRLFASTRVGDQVTIVKGSLAAAGAPYLSSVDQPTLD